MQLHSDINKLGNINNPIVTIGTFDGVHAGHRTIIRRIIDLAKKQNGESVLVTFEPHPRFLINPNHNLVLFTLGSVEDHLGNSTEAERLYLKVVSNDPEFFDVNYNLGVLYFNRGADVMNDAMIENRGKKEIRAAKKQTVALFSKSKFYLEKAEKLLPSNREILFALKRLYTEMGDHKNLKRLNEITD